MRWYSASSGIVAWIKYRWWLHAAAWLSQIDDAGLRSLPTLQLCYGQRRQHYSSRLLISEAA